MTGLSISILGPLQARIDGRILDLGTRKQRALFALLVINRRRAVSTERIISNLWGDDAPPKRREDVWVYVSRLRKTLAPASDTLQRRPGGYVLEVDDSSIDAVRFESLADEAHGLLPHDPAAASLVLGEALSMWSGRAFEEFKDEGFADPETARLEEARLRAIEMRIEADLTWREADQLIPEIEGLAIAHPLRSNLTASLMVALYRRGRQADALRAYGRFAKRLGDEVGLEPPEDLKALEEEILLDNPAVRRAAPMTRSRIREPIAPFVGRDAELSDVSELIAAHRLVTLTGPGGVGKSALSLEVARRLAIRYDDVAFVDLTRAEQSRDILAVVAGALQVPVNADGAVDSILHRLGTRGVLLVFDNCEPVLASAAQAAVSLLHGAPGLRILATSRVVLGIPGEEKFRLTPLSTMPDGEAAQLLTTRISSIPAESPETISAENLHVLCIKTFGLPLAIELVAALLGTWSAKEVIAALDDPLEALVVPDRVGPEHHRELRANIAWSETLLPADSLTLLARLSVFRSSFTFAAASYVAGFEPLTDLAVRHEFRRLVDASLVIRVGGSSTRYHLLEPVRQHAAMRLSESGETIPVAERHSEYFADQFALLNAAIDEGTDPGALERAQLDDENLLAAILWSMETGDIQTARRTTNSAVPFWRATSDISAVFPTIDAVIKVSRSPDKTLAELIFNAAPLYTLMGDSSGYQDLLGDLKFASGELGDPEVDAWLDIRRAGYGCGSGGPEDVIAVLSEAAANLREIGSKYAFNALHNLAWFQYWCWDRMAETDATIAQLREVTDSLGFAGHDPAVLSGWVSLARQDAEGVETALSTAATEYRKQGDHRMAALQMHGLAVGALQRGDVKEALRRIDVAVTASREMGAMPWLQNALMTRACANVELGNHDAASVDLIEVAETTRRSGTLFMAAALSHVTATALAASDPGSAATFLGAADTLLDGVSHQGLMIQRLVAPSVGSRIAKPAVGLRAQLGPEQFESAWSRGSRMEAETATALVLETLGNE